MRRLLVLAAVLLLPSLAMAHQNASGQPPQGQPKAQKMTSDAVMARLEKGDVFFLDVREPRELAELGTFEGYVNIPLGQIEKRLNEIPKDKPIITA
ncbi:MAG TPA: rhodanese-like domain-containing protein [Vicinamibacterales bacterium]|nr:rhodanese-like domain-containing protein [Vicinamibacterales bacterium]